MAFQQHRGRHDNQAVGQKRDYAADHCARHGHGMTIRIGEHEVQELPDCAMDLIGGKTVDDLRHAGPEEIDQQQGQPEICQVQRGRRFDKQHFGEFGAFSAFQLATGFIEPHGQHRRDKQKAACEHHDPACSAGE